MPPARASSVPVPPAGRSAILTCMDPRVQLGHRAGLDAAGAFMLRNAGGRVTDDVVRGLVLCTRVLEVTEIGVLHHTDCRLQGRTNAELAVLTGVEADFLPFGDSASTVAGDVHSLRTCGLFGSQVRIWGGLYAVESGTVTVLVPAGPGGRQSPNWW
jgi:carbonic anhydrase